MKNKEIEELLNKIQECDSLHNNCDYLLEHDECYILIEHIKQLETEKKEANESITWWTNRFSAVERENRNLKNNRDKAIEYVETHTENIDRGTYYEDYVETYDLLNILKGDSE